MNTSAVLQEDDRFALTECERMRAMIDASRQKGAALGMKVFALQESTELGGATDVEGNDQFPAIANSPFSEHEEPDPINPDKIKGASWTERMGGKR